jgi:MacB-like protein
VIPEPCGLTTSKQVVRQCYEECCGGVPEYIGRGIITLLDQGGNGPKQFSSVPIEEIPSNFLDTIGTPLVLGRAFTAESVNAHTPVLIVSESTARSLWPGDSALGKLLRVEQPMRDGSTKMISSSAQVVGVARDNQLYSSGETPRREASAVEPVLRLFVRAFEEKIAREQSIMSAASGLTCANNF